MASEPAKVNPASLSIEELARLLSAAGGRKITPEEIQADLDAGAPTLPGNKINLIWYAAWLTRQSTGESSFRAGESS